MKLINIKNQADYDISKQATISTNGIMHRTAPHHHWTKFQKAKDDTTHIKSRLRQRWWWWLRQRHRKRRQNWIKFSFVNECIPGAMMLIWNDTLNMYANNKVIKRFLVFQLLCCCCWSCLFVLGDLFQKEYNYQAKPKQNFLLNNLLSSLVVVLRWNMIMRYRARWY